VSVYESSESCFRRAFAVIFLVCATTIWTVATCVTEVNKIAKTSHGLVKSPQGEAIAGANIEVLSSSEDTIFRTKSARDGSFLLSAKPGKYRVKVSADGYLEFSYIVDLRSRDSVATFDVWLQNLSQCHDVRIVTGPDEGDDKCSSEPHPGNLILGARTIISGHVNDETGAPFKYSPLVLQKLSDSILQPAYMEAKTDADGHFTFDEAEAGKYRLVATPSRGFAQPEELDCYSKQNCNLEIVLKASPTDQPYAGCPVR
jgi:hypothetical protein